jgi:regulator of replication initiation timing
MREKKISDASDAIESGHIRPEKFCEDALAETCEALRIELGLKKNTINELTEENGALKCENAALLSRLSAEENGSLKCENAVLLSRLYAEENGSLKCENAALLSRLSAVETKYVDLQQAVLATVPKLQDGLRLLEVLR